MTRRTLATLLIAVVGIVTQSAAADHTQDSLDDVKKNVAEKRAVLVDVREPKEWDRGHLAGAELVPLSELSRQAADPDFKSNLAKRLRKDRIVYCHCAKGARALMAADHFKSLGYDVRPLKAGFDELRQAGFPAAKAPDGSGP